jgi:hypothetical protein
MRKKHAESELVRLCLSYAPIPCPVRNANENETTF